ncbi:MAG: RNA-dependent DNA polymerase [Gammaproteobacteria bacterium]|nr:RNA-dependent DNA polymerase [Gammaproteobacteria bacterium]
MARQYENLFPGIIEFGNLYAAFRRAAKGKRGKWEVADFEWNLESELWRLHEQLGDGSYRPGGYYSFYIRDPKHRLISAAPFRDRVVHHALCNLIEPVFERTFIGDSYANRVEKGSHAALDRAQRFARRCRYVLQCDVRQFFPSIDHGVLLQILQRKIADERTLDLCGKIIQSGAGVLSREYKQTYFPGDDLFAALRPRGLPIGNLTSQFWANVYLNELDQFIKRQLRCKEYLRYVDDFLLFSDDKQQLWNWKLEVKQYLIALRLSLHEKESTVYPVESGIPFLGFRIYPDHRRLKRRNGVNFSRRLRRNYRAYARGELAKEELDIRVQGWIAHAKHGDTWRLRASLLRNPLPKQ